MGLAQDACYSLYGPDNWFSTFESRQKSYSPKELAAADAYPEWAPNVFVLDLIHGRNLAASDEGRGFLADLCTKPEMETVWRRLHKRDLKKQETYEDWQRLARPGSVKFAYQASIARFGYSTAADNLSPKQRDEKTAAIRKKLDALATELGKFRIDPYCLSLWNPTELDSTLPKENEHFGRQALISNSPKVSELLKRLSSELELRPIGATSLITNNTKDNEVTRFIRHMGGFFKMEYDEALYKVISILTAAIFGIEFEESTIRKMTQASP